MAWLSRVNFIASDTLSFTDVNNLGNDIRAWGDNINGGGYTLSNVVVSASAGTMATLSGGGAASSTLTLRSTSVAGTTDAIIFQTGSQVERLRIVTTGEVGIGTTTPSSLLDVGTVAGTDNFITVTSSGLSRVRLGYQASTSPTNNVNQAQIFADGTGNINFASRTNNASGLLFYTNSGTAASERMRITSAGNVGVGLTSISYQFQVATDSAAKPSTNTWTIASDARLKTVKGEYTKGLTEICQIRPVRYEYNGKGDFDADGKEQISILAQELMQVFPECVGTFRGKLTEEGPETDLYNYNGHAITFALINAIKELKAEIDLLKAAQ